MKERKVLFSNELTAECSGCESEVLIRVGLEDVVSPVRSGLSPKSAVLEYEIPLERIERYMTNKLNHVMREIGRPGSIPLALFARNSRDGEKKSKSKNAPSFTALFMAVPDDVLEDSTDTGKHAAMLRSIISPSIEKSIYLEIMRKYNFSEHNLRMLRKDYKNQDYLQRVFGITWEFIETIYTYAIPKYHNLNVPGDKKWMRMAINPIKVISEMLEPIEFKSMTKEELVVAAEAHRKSVNISRVTGSGNGITFHVNLYPAGSQHTIKPLVAELFKDL